jgi:hypothetical protein
VPRGSRPRIKYLGRIPRAARAEREQAHIECTIIVQRSLQAHHNIQRMNRNRMLLLMLLCAALLSAPAFPCSLRYTPFLENLSAATHVYVFRLESAKAAGPESVEVRGTFRIVEVLKGGSPPAKALQYWTDSCGGVRLDVGGYYLAATRDAETTLRISGGDDTVLDLFLSYSEGSRSEFIDEIRRILDGGTASLQFQNDLERRAQRIRIIPPPQEPFRADPAPEPWAPETLSSDQYESSPAFTPDGSEMFFMRSDRSFQNYRLLWSRCVRGQWTAPVSPPFAAPAPVLEGDPVVTADGKRVYFISSRLAHQRNGGDDLDIWYADRGAGGEWLPPRRLPEPVNSSGSELLPRLTPDGSLYFGSSRAGGLGGSDIYVAKPGPKDTWHVENLGAPVNSTANEYEAEVSSNGKMLIVVADRGDRSHLYPFTLEKGAWVEGHRIVARPDVFQVGPLLSPGGKRLLFAQDAGAKSGELFVLDLVPNPDESWPPGCGR